MSSPNQRINEDPRSAPSSGQNNSYMSCVLGSLPGRGMASPNTSELETPITRSVAMFPPLSRQALKNLESPVTRLADNNPYAASNPYAPFNSDNKSRLHGAVSTNWSVPDGSLQSVPDYFALERTSRFVAGTGASIVSARISDCLRRRSIATKFDNTKAKAKCVNVDFVQFRIRLFAGRNEYKNGVIVEVQRRSGGSLSFHRDCRALLDSAEGLDFASESREETKCSLSGFGFLKSSEDIELSRKRSEESSASALEIAAELLKKDRIDANTLGMESLSYLTDNTKSSELVAKQISRNIILDDTNSGVRSKIMEFVMFSPVNKEEGSEFRHRLHNLALQVLSNALHVTAEDGVLNHEVHKHAWFSDNLVPMLINELKDAKNRPHDALLAARAMNTLINTSGQIRNKAIEIGAKTILTDARDYGISSHAFLATETERCVSTLECAC